MSRNAHLKSALVIESQNLLRYVRKIKKEAFNLVFEEETMTGVGSKDGNLLSQFRFERILSENSLAKSVAVFGKLPSDTGDNSTVVLVEKTPFTQETVKNLLTGNTTFTHNSQHDNIGQYTSDAGIKLTVIHPATEKHVKEYTHQDTVMVQETATAYATKIKPYAEVEARNLQVHYMCAYPSSILNSYYKLPNSVPPFLKVELIVRGPPQAESKVNKDYFGILES